MPTLVLSRTTMQRLKRLAVGRWKSEGVERADGLFNVPIDHEVHAAIQSRRRPGDKDEDVVLRVLAENHGGTHGDEPPSAA